MLDRFSPFSTSSEGLTLIPGHSPCFASCGSRTLADLSGPLEGSSKPS